MLHLFRLGHSFPSAVDLPRSIRTPEIAQQTARMPEEKDDKRNKSADEEPVTDFSEEPIVGGKHTSLRVSLSELTSDAGV